MFKIEYVHSADPLLRLLRSRPQEVFGRPYAGYLIFLFGNADPAVASWMRDQLIALDSLTGPDIAGVVFAKSVGITARVISHYTPRPPRRGQGQKIHNGNVALDDVEFDPYPEKFNVRPMVEHDRHAWEGSVTELQATTYAADEIAREFGIVDKLPCLIIADAVPTKEFDAISLTEGELHTVIPLLRTAIGQFLRSPGISACLSRTMALAHYSKKSDELHRKIRHAEFQRRQNIDNIDLGAPERIKKAHWYLLAGSARGFEKEINSLLFLDCTARNNAISACRIEARLLNRFSKTVNSISQLVAKADWPPSSEVRQRLERILTMHVRDLMPITTVSIDIESRLSWEGLLTQMRASHDALAQSVWGDLPSVNEFEAIIQDKLYTITRNADEIKEALIGEAACIDHEIDIAISHLLENFPSLRQAFQGALRGRKLQSLKHTLTRGAADILTAFLRPATRPLFARDVYIGNNVGAMGPGATATGATFVAKATPTTTT